MELDGDQKLIISVVGKGHERVETAPTPTHKLPIAGMYRNFLQKRGYK